MNKNNTTLICTLNNAGSDVLVWKIGAFLFPMIGLPGHILMIVTILTSDRRNYHPISLYFIFMAIAESIYLLFLFWDWLDVVNLAPDPRKILNCAYFYPFVSSTAFISLILLVLINIDRIHMINNPLKTHQNLTNQRIFMKIFLTYTTSILFLIHYHFSLKYSREAFVIYGQSCCVYDHAYQWFYTIWPYIHLFCRLIPCLIIISCALYICWNRCHHHHHYYIRNSMNSIHRQQQTFSIVLVFLSIYTFFSVLPITILQLFNQQMSQYEIDYRYYCRYDINKTNKWKLLNALFIMWEASTYSSKFYIRFLFSSQFRHHVKQTIFCRFKIKYRHRQISN